MERQDFEKTKLFLGMKARIRTVGGLLNPVTIAELQPGNGTKYVLVFVPVRHIETPNMGRVDGDGVLIIYDRTKMGYFFPHTKDAFLSREYVEENLFNYANPIDVACVTALIAYAFDGWTNVTLEDMDVRDA